MEYEAGLVVSGPMTQLEADIWIQNMENHFGSNLISRKYEVEHALQYFTESAAIWWKMNHAIQGFSGAETWDEFKKTLLRSRLIQKCYDNPKEKTCACKICGAIGHTQEEHKDGCTHCEENHAAGECPSSQVTCFLYEGTTHYPAQCHIYPKVQEVVKQQKDAVKETLKKKILEEPMTTLYESFLKGPETIMTLTSDHDYSKILKDMMKHIHLEGDAVYKGYPFMESGVELWYVEVHLHHVKGVCPKTMGQYFFISRVPRAIFFDAVREAAMEAIRQIGETLEARLRHTQEYLSEVHAEMMEVKLMTTMMKQKMDDLKEHIGKFQWN
ncbi:hypothetical protein ZWY2020_049650 [Hordeum vulgare]|nr:hypothetical protein ZWY2020_049650 [Hordeum vulgare]